ncbi:MAG TPA: PQQ-binding-like beta-propeller repeat protein [Symbiobacteriaceae bacterium]|nr:PQQ-binding-like beta-propeller repeat protein [Symbiobacteriaceae bacterium]
MTAPGSWTGARGDSLNRAAVSTGPGNGLQSLWTADSIHSARLTLYGDTLYAAGGTSPGSLVTFDAATGKQKWEKRLGATVTPPGSGALGVYVSEFRAAVLAFRPDGTELWRLAIKGETPPLVTAEMVVVGDSAGSVHALHPETGKSLWSTPLGQGGFSSRVPPSLYNGSLFLATASQVVALDAATGTIRYTIAHGSANGVVVDNGFLYLTEGEKLYAFDPATGRELWATALGKPVYRPIAAAKGLVIVPTQDARLQAVDGVTGKVVWTAVLDTYGSAYGSPAVAGDLVYMGAYGGGLKLFKLQTGEAAGVLLPGVRVPETPVITDSHLYAAGDQRGLHALKKP